MTASRATVAADAAGDAEPLTFLEHELAKNGQLPVGEEAARVLADAKTAQALVAALDEQPVREPRRMGPAEQPAAPLRQRAPQPPALTTDRISRSHRGDTRRGRTRGCHPRGRPPSMVRTPHPHPESAAPVPIPIGAGPPMLPL